MLWILLATAAIILYLALGSPKLALIAWLFSFLLLEHYKYLVPGLPLLTISSLTIAPMFFLHLFLGRLAAGWKQVPTSLLVPMMLVVAVQTLQLFRTHHAMTQVVQVFLGREIYPLLLFLMVITLEWKKKDLKITMFAVMLALGAGSIAAIYEHFTKIPVFFSTDDYVLELFPFRPTGLFTTVANLCAISTLGILSYLPALVDIRNFFTRVLAWLLTGSVIAAAYFANYRGTLGPFILLFVLFMLLKQNRRIPTVLAILVAGGVLISQWANLSQSEIYERRLAEQGSSRVATYLHSFKVIAKQPLVGAGFENVVDVMEAETPTYFDGSISRPTPHNTILLFLLEGGLLSLMIFSIWYFNLFMLISSVTKGLTKKYGPEIGWIPAMLMLLYLAINMTQASYNATLNAYLYFVLAQYFALSMAPQFPIEDQVSTA